jgi:prophage antirepressor-like protein
MSMRVQFENVALNVTETGNARQWYMTVEEVATGYGVQHDTIRKHLERHADEFRNGFERGVTICPTLGGAQDKTVLYREGVIKMGFFVRSPRAASFRQWATAVVLAHMDANGISIHDMLSGLREELHTGLAGIRRVVSSQQVEIDELRAMLNLFATENEVEVLRARIHDVAVAKGEDGRTTLGRMRKCFGVSTPYTSVTIPLAMNWCNTELGGGLRDVSKYSQKE